MNTAIILAAGKGSRMHAGMNKQFLPLSGKPLLAHTLEAFQNCRAIDGIIVVADREELELCKELIIDAYGFDKVDKLVPGGRVRQQSVYNGLLELPENCSVVVVHDGARPIVTGEIIERCIEGAEAYGAVSAGMPAKETIKVLDGRGFVKYTPERDKVWITQTPQAFKPDIIRKAHESAAAEGISGTDDAFLVEILGIQVKMIESSYENIKVTTPEDIIVAETLMGKSNLKEGKRGDKMTPGFRIGNGYDVHRLAEGRKLILGGVEIPYEKGLLGHSDADVLVHAIMDALLGACGEYDIGKQFPDSDAAYKGISSLILLEKVRAAVSARGYRISNIDSIIVAERPKLAAYIDGMREKLSAVLQLEKNAVGIKATTTEGLGFTGTGEGIAAYAVACIYPEEMS